ncbi:hypothetical protein AHF37_08319 [Paragonimus kellicotti]|nr:hypothetical protein AHF37_08319 [Paragonimus kellicotti]
MLMCAQMISTMLYCNFKQFSKFYSICLLSISARNTVLKGSSKRWEKMILENPARSILHTRFKRLPEPINSQTGMQRSSSKGRSRSGKRPTKRSKQKSKSASSRSTSRSRSLKIILRKPHVKTRPFLSARPYKPRRVVSNYGHLSADRLPKTSSVPYSSGSAVVGNATLGQFTRSYVELGIRAGVERKLVNSPRTGTLTGRTSVTGSIIQSVSTALERGSAGGSHMHQLRRMRYMADLRSQSLELDERVARFCEEIESFVNACREETNGPVQTGRDIILDSAFAVSMLLA